MKNGIYKIGEVTFSELNGMDGRKFQFMGAKPKGMAFVKGFLRCDEEWKSKSDVRIIAESRVYVQDAAMAEINELGSMVTEINNVIQTDKPQDAMVMLIFGAGKENPRDWESGKFSVHVQLENLPEL